MRYLVPGAVCAVLWACGQSGGTANLATADDSASYVIGYQIGTNLKRQSIPANPDVVLRGLREALAGTDPLLTPEQAQAAMMGMQTRVTEGARTRDSAAAAANTEAGARFLEQNARAAGVQADPSGLQWKVIKEGSGARPVVTSVVTVHYKGSLLDGTVFDSSATDQPVSFPLNQVIPGWTQAVQKMAPGARYQFWIPGDLAYGAQGSPPAIGPNQTLVFEIELVSFR
ncbi:MAG TPA: FKBP-type peptidyl-prolyl cis-trans isomerase [Gemmatimonadales bacterium]|nr:FKBP-type peptidyl-prolyl cis-trans isomerase [Gemmatimonadales bacterium]